MRIGRFKRDWFDVKLDLGDGLDWYHWKEICRHHAETDAAIRAERATWHAKCVVVDDDRAFVTCANFTEWAQGRNVEARVLVHGQSFAQQLRKPFESLVEGRIVRRLPGC